MDEVSAGPPGSVSRVPLPGRRQGRPRRRPQRCGRPRERDGVRHRVSVSSGAQPFLLRDTTSSSPETATRPRWCASLSCSPLGKGPSPQRELPGRPPGPVDEAPGPGDAAEAGVRTWHSGPRPCGGDSGGGAEESKLVSLGLGAPQGTRVPPASPLSLVTGARGCCHRRWDGPARGHRLQCGPRREAGRVPEAVADDESHSVLVSESVSTSRELTRLLGTRRVDPAGGQPRLTIATLSRTCTIKTKTNNRMSVTPHQAPPLVPCGHTAD